MPMFVTVLKRQEVVLNERHPKHFESTLQTLDVKTDGEIIFSKLRLRKGKMDIGKLFTHTQINCYETKQVPNIVYRFCEMLNTG